MQIYILHRHHHKYKESTHDKNFHKTNSHKAYKIENSSFFITYTVSKNLNTTHYTIKIAKISTHFQSLKFKIRLITPAMYNNCSIKFYNTVVRELKIVLSQYFA